jgi:hypothetical protein
VACYFFLNLFSSRRRLLRVWDRSPVSRLLRMRQPLVMLRWAFLGSLSLYIYICVYIYIYMCMYVFTHRWAVN